ncbi:MAG: DNA polymerase Y family protein [Actinobacteria bacterium]|nr:DNA polymerase Y family protein [Actinomycetota bacterium]
MPRIGVLWCPHWPVVVAGAASTEAVMVLRANRVVAHSLAAGAEGIAVGQRRRDAQARCPLVRIEQHDPAGDARAFERVVQAVGTIVPRIEITEPGMLTFIARGPSRYFGGDAAMATTVVRIAIESLGESAGLSLTAVGSFGMGVADGRFAAGVAARRSARAGTPAVVTAGQWETAAFLARLPVRLLTVVAGVPAEFVQLLTRLGVHDLGSLAALPEVDVAARFGPLGSFSHRIASGVDDRLPGTHDPPAGLQVDRIFEQPVHHSDVLVFVARQLAEELAGQLAGDGRVCTRLVVIAETEHGEKSERVWYRSSGLSAAAMVERVRWQLDAWAQRDTITAGVTLLRLDPVEVCSDEGVQMGLWGGRTQADEWAVRAVTRLVAIAGEQQVLVPAAQGGRHPHEAFKWVPAITVDLLEHAERYVRGAAPWPGQLPVPSPAIVHAPPKPISVGDAVGREVRVTGRGTVSAAPAVVRFATGPAEAVQSWAGPWPVEERWWDLARARRLARFQVLTRSGRLLLLTVEQGQWWLTAEYA